MEVLYKNCLACGFSKNQIRDSHTFVKVTKKIDTHFPYFLMDVDEIWHRRSPHNEVIQF